MIVECMDVALTGKESGGVPFDLVRSDGLSGKQISLSQPLDFAILSMYRFSS